MGNRLRLFLALRSASLSIQSTMKKIMLLAVSLAWAMPGPAQSPTVPAPGNVTPASANLFAHAYKGARANFTGQVGYEFIPAAKLRVTALGRSVSGGRLQRNHQIILWDTTTTKRLANVTVSPASEVDSGSYASELLKVPVWLSPGQAYRITSSEEAGGDPFFDLADVGEHQAAVEVRSGVFATGDTYPAQTYGHAEQGYGLPTIFFDVAGLGPTLLKAGREPTPFLRDVTTGYLLNCFFMSPRPYCWQGTDCRLSGWEVDRSGGNIAFQPTCGYPEGFAFHSDWFKLVDTSSNAAIILKHQIARQTNGQLTLEFRFKLPARMDGACWQLRDLEQAGVSLVTADGNLCVEGSDGKLLVLAPIEDGREYGVKVVADLTTKTADVFVDGDLKAPAVSFAHPVRTIDYFVAKTGDAASGEMFLNPVNIFKGYAVNETFVTCGAGKLPSGWTSDPVERTISVEQFECGTKPDIFSLKLAATAERRAAAWRDFLPIQGKTVFEYRCRLPKRREGAGATLSGGKNGVRVATAGGDLCFFDKKSQPVPLVRDYRTNLWYMVKVIADPAAGTADVFVNGKPAATQAKFLSGFKSFTALRFETERTTVMWIDDVQVYPWREYPADYVPEPKPVAVKNGFLLGAQSCNLWREGTAYAGWDYVYPYRDKRKPYLGWYDEGHPEETDWEIKWQVEHGIGFEQHCWYRPNNAINHPIKDGVLDQGLIKGLFNARYSHLKKFTIMCTDEGACETNPEDWRENIIPYWIEYFFKDPRYLKIDGKPVLSIYHLGNLQRMFGGAEGARGAIQTLRDEVAKAGLPGIIVLMEDRTANPATLKTMQAIGVDACYAYTWGTPDSQVQRKQNAAQRDAAATVGFRSLPSISMGWDREAWGVREGGWLPVADYRALAQWARDDFIPTLPADSLGRRILMLANWNEFGEGHFLMPSTLAGFGYLDALREVFTAGGLHEDAKPNEQQQRRFGVLYPKD